MKAYYDRRAPEYDATTYERVLRDREAAADLAALVAFVRKLSVRSVLDVGCGTGWLTQFLAGRIVALDQSDQMLAQVRERVPGATLVKADAPRLPFPAASFDLVFTSHFLSHLPTADERQLLISEALRVGRELVVVEESWPAGKAEEGWETRTLGDGGEYRVFKRYFTSATLAAEIGGEIALETAAFIAARRNSSSPELAQETEEGGA